MSDLLKLLDRAAGVVGLEDDLKLIEALVAIGKKEADLIAHIDGVTSVETLLRTIVEDIDAPTVVSAFEAVGLADVRTRLSGLLHDVQALKDRIPEQYRKLLDPLSKYGAGASADAGKIDWKPIDEKRKFDVATGFSIEVDGDTGIGFEAGDRPAIADVRTPDPLLRLSVNAGVSSRIAGTIPIQFGTIGGGVEGALGVALDCYFEPAGNDEMYGAAVAERLMQLPNPFSYQGVWEAFQTTDLAVMVYTFTEHAKADVSVALTDSGSFSSVLLDVKATIAAEASLDRTFQLTLSAPKAAPGAGRQVAMLLTRGAQRKDGISAGLSVGVDFAIPAARVHAILQAAVDKWDGVLAELLPYLSPGTLLQTVLGGQIETKATELIADPNLRAAIVADLRTAIGIDTSSGPALTAWLTARIENAINSGADALLDEGNGVRDRALDALQGALPSIARTLPDTIRSKLSDAIDPLVARAKQELRDKVTALIARPGNVLAAALNKAKVFSKSEIQQLDDILKPLRDLITRFNQLLHDALAMTGDASKAKISASLQLADQWLWGEEDQIAGTFTDGNAEAAGLFENLTQGKLSELVKLILKGDDGRPQAAAPPGFTLDPARSWVKKSSEQTTTGSFALVLFGVGASGSWLVSGKAKVLVDGEGNVQVDSEARAETRFTTSRKGPGGVVRGHLRGASPAGRRRPGQRSPNDGSQGERHRPGQIDVVRRAPGLPAESGTGGAARGRRDHPGRDPVHERSRRKRRQPRQHRGEDRAGRSPGQNPDASRRPGWEWQAVKRGEIAIMHIANAALNKAGNALEFLDGGADRVRRHLMIEEAMSSDELILYLVDHPEIDLRYEYGQIDRIIPNDVNAVASQSERIGGLLAMVEGLGRIPRHSRRRRQIHPGGARRITGRNRLASRRERKDG